MRVASMFSSPRAKLVVSLGFILLAFGTFLFAQFENKVAGRSDSLGLYREHCASCHGLDGKAQTPKGKRKGATDLTKSKLADAKIIKIITDGRGNMPEFGTELSPDEIRSMMSYIKNLRK